MKNCRRILSLSLCVILAVGTLLPSVVTAAPERADQRGGEYRALPSEDAIASMSKFDGRDYGIVTPVKDQGSTNLCWAYSSVAASETSILRSGINPSATPENLNLNPQAAAYRISNRASDPLGNTDGEYIAGDFTAATGNPSKIATLFSLWWGPVSGKSAAVDPFENSEYRLESAVNIPENKDNPELRIETIKRAIAKYGAVTFQYNNASNIYYYNPKNETGSQSYPHACTIIGWDDTIPADSFAPGGASRNGGWLIKNSYSSLPDGYPYFYISYDNTCSYTYAFSYSLREKYDRNYCYDGAINDFPLRNDRVVANVYRAAGSEAEGKTEVLKAVNIGISGNSYTVEVEVFTGLSDPFGSANPPTDGGKSAAKKTQSFDFGGYVTVSLDTPVELSKGEWFSVIVRITDGNAKIRLGEKNGRNLSYAGTSGGFTKIGNYVGRIKALTSVIDALPDEDDTEYNFTNLVVLAKFSGEEEFANDVYQGATVAQIIDNTYNRAGYSVRDYFGAISNGKLKMRTLFLLDNGGSVTLSRPRGYYAEKDDFNPDGYEAGYENLRIAELREDWADAVNDAIAAGNLPTDISGKVYDAGELDKNGDGKIDCITVIYKPTVQNISVGWSSPLWDYHYYSPFVGISTDGGELISSEYVQLTLSYMTADGRSALYKGADALPIASLGKICHETLHVFGLKDLYRSDLSSEVYFMSAMGKPLSPAVQFISVKEREALGFLSGDDILTLSCDGSYSLDVSSPHSSGTVGYKLELPERGRTLYLEYRRFEGSANRYDTKSKELYSCATGELIRGQTLKSGLVCYLAKSGVRFPSNLNGTNEYVVVSGGIYSTKSDAAIAPGESINITDEINITVTEMSEGALRFEISGIGDVTPPHTHKLERTEGIPATCVADGVRAHYRCTECGAYFDADDTTTPVEYSSLIIPSKDGAHDLRLVTAAAPSCTGDGHVEYYECRLCGKLFADSAAEREISADDVRFLGDGNRDGKINVKDIVIAIRAAIGQTMDNIDLDALDINRDGNVDVKDIIILIRHSTGYKQSYLIGYPMSSVPSAKPAIKVVSGVEFITYTSSITYKGQKDEYAYTAQNDGLVRIDISELKSGIYVDLYVYDRLGEEVVFRDYCKNNSGVSIPKAKAGDTYRIQVRYNNEFGDYVLTIGQPKPVIDVTSFKEVRDSIQYTEQYNYYTFTPSVDGLYRFDLNNMQSDFYVRLYLYDRLGYEVSAHEYCANNGITGTNLKAGEEYKIAVEYVRGFGDYSLVIGRQNPTVDISGLTEISDRITFKEQKNVYSFTAPSDGDCRFDITEMKSDVHVGLYVYDRLGYEVVSHGYCSNNSGITLNGMKSGETYKIVVVYITGFGDYTLTINH